MFDYEANTVVVSFKVSRGLFKKINDTAKKAHLQRSTFIRKAVIDYIENLYGFERIEASVLSPKSFPNFYKSCMAKLTPAKIRWIIREKERGELTTEQIARIQRITPRRVNQLWREYRDTGELPILKEPGRPPKPITADQIRAVLEAYNKYRLGACMLERILEEEFGVKMSHNKIHRVLRQHGLAKREPKKAKRRKWVRYERKHVSITCRLEVSQAGEEVDDRLSR